MHVGVVPIGTSVTIILLLRPATMLPPVPHIIVTTCNWTLLCLSCIISLSHYTEFKAIHSFDGSAEEGSLHFTQGDVVLVYWAHDNGWWYGAAKDSQGWFPGSFVEVRNEFCHVCVSVNYLFHLTACHGELGGR